MQAYKPMLTEPGAKNIVEAIGKACVWDLFYAYKVYFTHQLPGRIGKDELSKRLTFTYRCSDLLFILRFRIIL